MRRTQRGLSHMITLEASVVIDKPVEDVYEFVADPTNDPQWHTDIIDVRMPAGGDVEVGTVFTVVVKFMGRRTGTVEISDLQPGRLIEYTTKDGTIRPIARCLMEPIDGGTRFTRHVEIPREGFLRVVGPAIRGTAQRRQERFAHNLKQLLES
jgi:uncharacterized protein YndB with AHSA1/START domain